MMNSLTPERNSQGSLQPEPRQLSHLQPLIPSIDFSGDAKLCVASRTSEFHVFTRADPL